MVAKSKNAAGVAAFLAPALLSLACARGGESGWASMAASPQTASWRFGDAHGSLLTTDHYRIYTTSDNRAMRTYLPGFMEGAYRHYAALTGLGELAGGERLAVYLFGSRPQWAAMTSRLTGPRKALYLAVENGGYCYQGVCVFWDMGHFATFSVAAHEGTHQFLHHRLRHRVPAWAEEGLAVLAEGFEMTASAVRFTPERNSLRQTALRRAISGGRWLPLEEILASDAADHLGKPATGPEYYAHLWALLGYIRSRPALRAGLEQMLADAAAGRLRAALNVPPAMGRGRSYGQSVGVPAFQHYIESDLDGFEKAFRAYAREQARL